jgi:hypothetical protein
MIFFGITELAVSQDNHFNNKDVELWHRNKLGIKQGNHGRTCPKWTIILKLQWSQHSFYIKVSGLINNTGAIINGLPNQLMQYLLSVSMTLNAVSVHRFFPLYFMSFFLSRLMSTVTQHHSQKSLCPLKISWICTACSFPLLWTPLD